jgi:hypothetical protein
MGGHGGQGGIGGHGGHWGVGGQMQGHLKQRQGKRQEQLHAGPQLYGCGYLLFIVALFLVILYFIINIVRKRLKIVCKNVAYMQFCTLFLLRFLISV